LADPEQQHREHRDGGDCRKSPSCTHTHQHGLAIDTPLPLAPSTQFEKFLYQQSLLQFLKML
jgi:hypothetical protein